MAYKRQTPSKVIIGWFLANLLAVTIVALVPLIHQAALLSRGGIFVSSLIVGLPIGIAQWIALRRVAPISLLWIFSVAVALPLSLVIVNSLAYLRVFGSLGDESIITFALAYAVIGLVVGLIQWVLLRGHFAKHYFWPPVSSAGFGIGMGLVLAWISQSGIAPIILGVLIYAIVTGPLISWMRASGADDEIGLSTAA